MAITGAICSIYGGKYKFERCPNTLDVSPLHLALYHEDFCIHDLEPQFYNMICI